MRPLKKILHIDDDAVMRMMIKKSLDRSDKGFEVISCSIISEFINHITTFSPDLLIIDVVMPTTDGPTLLEKVRRLHCRTPAIFMTGQESPDLSSHISLEPILGIIHKPFSPTLLSDDLMRFWEQWCKRE
jgi:two-component system cell cycle sensor histidine kinase/response regulator CckA